MRRILCPAALLALAIPALSSGADDAPVTREEHDRVLREIEDLRRDLAELRAGRPPAPAPLGTEPGGSGDVVAAAGPGGYQGVRDKPFLATGGPKAYLGGYFDIEYRDAENARHEFRFHRLIPFIYADIHERIQFASEIEFEDGGEEVGVEFAFIDIKIIEPANFRGGAILEPLGKFNLIHDSPINDLTDRPLVNQFVIPTTFHEIGVGLFGTLTPPEADWDVKYEAYLTSGFKGLDDAGNTAISVDDGLRDARAAEDSLGTSRYDDINNAFAGVGRVSVSPLLGTEVGVSAHTGTYDESSENNLTIAAVDGLYTIPRFEVADVPVGPMELLAEGAYAFIERNDFARASGIPGDLWGYYGQMNYHFMPAFLTENVPELFFSESTFTLVGRWDHVDLDEARRYRITAGLNFRPVESTVFKFDYQMNWGSGTAPETTDDDAFVFSIASYF